MNTLGIIITLWLVLSLPFSIAAGKCLKRCNERDESVRRLRIG
ncbi:hypothetical protein [Mesorhizobium sp.]|nr:hypothetical protein [Mesorhizobium sp.]